MKKFAFFLVFALILSGCAVQPVKAEREIFAMDTVMSLQVWGEGGEDALDSLQQTLQEMESRLSVTRENSVLGAINRAGSGELSDREAQMLGRVLELSEGTAGALDPCLYPVTALWGFTTGDYRVPAPGEIENALALTGRDKITLEGSTVTLAPGARLDLGAAVKGWAGAVCARDLEGREDVTCALLNLGGNVQTVGTKADGSDWCIGIRDPQGGTLGNLHLAGTWAVVTSGGYQRFFEQDGVTYCHIMDPATGAPARSGLLSVTVVCRDGLDADCLSTALYVLGLRDGAEFWRENRDFEAVWVTDSGEIYATEGMENRLFDCDFEVIYP